MPIQTKRWQFIIERSKTLKRLTKNDIQGFMLHIRVYTYEQLISKLKHNDTEAKTTKKGVLSKYIESYVAFFESEIMPDYISFNKDGESIHEKQRTKIEVMHLFYDTLLYMKDDVFTNRVRKAKSNNEDNRTVNVDLSENNILHDKLCLIKSSFPSDELLVMNVCSCKGSRLAAGLNELDPLYEISYQKDFFTQAPVLLGSAVKGVFSHYCKECGIKEYDVWFGTEDQVGKITFFDAIAIKCEVYADYMTNHYFSYYTKGQLLNEKPVPLLFHSVKIKMMEIILCCDSSIDSKEVKRCFRECLEECSFGAKGAVGYGFLEIPENRD